MTVLKVTSKRVSSPQADIIGNTCQDNSIKSGERSKMGMVPEDTRTINAIESTSNFTDFWNNGESNLWVIELMLEATEKNRFKVMNVLRCIEMCFLVEHHCSNLKSSYETKD